MENLKEKFPGCRGSDILAGGLYRDNEHYACDRNRTYQRNRTNESSWFFKYGYSPALFSRISYYQPLRRPPGSWSGNRRDLYRHTYPESSLPLSPSIFEAGFLIAIIVGIAAGVYPASKAVKMAHVDASRYK